MALGVESQRRPLNNSDAVCCECQGGQSQSRQHPIAHPDPPKLDT